MKISTQKADIGNKHLFLSLENRTLINEYNEKEYVSGEKENLCLPCSSELFSTLNSLICMSYLCFAAARIHGAEFS